MNQGPSRNVSNASQRSRLQRPVDTTEPYDIHRIYVEIREKSCRGYDDQKAFILPKVLQEIWRDTDRIKKIVFPRHSGRHDSRDVQFVQENQTAILSTFILSKWSKEILPLFRETVFARRLTDKAIPFAEDDLVFLDPKYREDFMRHQDRFKPEILTCSRTAKPLEFGAHRRLPFQKIEEAIGMGAYVGKGTVDLVHIPAGYIKVFDQTGNYQVPYDETKVFAVKTFRKHADVDFQQEFRNLSNLANTLNAHPSVMLFHAAIIHGDEYYILMNRASVGNLQTFLNGGKNVRDQVDKHFDQRYSSFPKGDVSSALLYQCREIAGALKWLHYELTEADTYGHISCIHMDLKPENIVIDEHRHYKVGVWKICDFGISAISDSAEYLTPGDYDGLRTRNTRARREAGRCSAPEVWFPAKPQHELSREELLVGRKSDVWSYACVLAEVLAYAANPKGSTGVAEFRRKRKGMRNNDDFCEPYDPAAEFSNQMLSVPSPGSPVSNQHRRYRLATSVGLWLSEFSSEGHTRQDWMRCFARTLKQFFIEDPNERPDSKVLHEQIAHVWDHVRNFQHAHYPCENLQQGRNNQFQPRIVTEDHEQPEPISANTDDEVVGSRRPSYQPPERSYGILVNPEHERSLAPFKAAETREPKGDFKRLVVASSFSHLGYTAACLVEPRRSRRADRQRSVHLYGLNSETSSLEYRKTIDLPPHVEWSKISINGQYLAAWGRASGAALKRVFLCSTRNPNDAIRGPDRQELSTLAKIAISADGIAALMCLDVVFCLKIDNGPEQRSVPLQAENLWHFSDVAFNDGWFFAWSYLSGGKGRLSLWNIKDGAIGEHRDVDQNFEQDNIRPSHSTKVFPYHSYKACIVHEPEFDVYFAASPSTYSPLPDEMSHRSYQPLNHSTTVTACMFESHSLLVAMDDAIFEHQIDHLAHQTDHHAYHHLNRDGTRICKLDKHCQSTSTLQAFRQDGIVFVVLLRLDLRVQVMKFLPNIRDADSDRRHRNRIRAIFFRDNR